MTQVKTYRRAYETFLRKQYQMESAAPEVHERRRQAAADAEAKRAEYNRLVEAQGTDGPCSVETDH